VIAGKTRFDRPRVFKELRLIPIPTSGDRVPVDNRQGGIDDFGAPFRGGPNPEHEANLS
jgi:hypothetical protein